MHNDDVPGRQSVASLQTRLAEMRRVLSSLSQRAEVLQKLIATRTISEPCPEESLPCWRRWGRRLLAWLGWRLPQAVRTRDATPSELSAAARELERKEDAIGRLESALARLPQFPSPADPSELRIGDDGYPEDWEAISLAHRRAVGFLCERCGSHAPDGHVHHMHPVSRGGGSEDGNLVFLCRACHAGEHPHMREV